MKKLIVKKPVFIGLKWIYLGLCLSGLAWQTIHSSIFYFDYQVVSSIILKLPFKAKVGAINFCFNAEDLINETKIEHIGKMHHTTKDLSVNEVAQRNVQNILTTTPSIAEFESYIMNNKRALKHPISRKYFIAGYVCYVQIPKVDMVQMKELKSGEFSKIVFKIPIKFPARKIFLSSKKRKSPWQERLLASRESFIGGNLKLYGYKIKLYKITAPYQDDCFEYLDLKFESKQEAISDCTQHELGKFNMSSCISYYGENDNSLPMECFFYQSKNFTAKVLYENASAMCLNKYPKSQCYTSIMISESKLTERSKSDLLTIQQDFSNTLSTKLHSSAKIQLVDYVTFILGAFGAWLGFSFYTFNPISRMFSIRNSTITPIKSEITDSNKSHRLLVQKLSILNQKLNSEYAMRKNMQTVMVNMDNEYSSKLDILYSEIRCLKDKLSNQTTDM